MTEFAGLPLHPLLVHVAVVLLPLAAFAFIVVAFVPKWRRPIDVIALVGLVIGTVFAIAAKFSGEGLAEIVGNPAEHAEWGNVLPWFAIVLTAIATVWFWKERQSAANAKDEPIVRVLGIAGSVLAIIVIAMTVIVGHSGAEAVWAGTIKPSGDSSSSSSSSSASPNASAGAEMIVLADVKKHDTAKDCWSAVAGNVYNLTDWISQHPGGEAAIEGMCGTDATDAFTAQHGGQGRPERELGNFLIGPLS